jgi:hypothetical protein
VLLSESLCKFFLLHGGNPEKDREPQSFLFISIMTIPNLLIIAGIGTKSGKTSLACRIIKQMSNLKITAIKITPHFHETTEGLIVRSEKKGYAIYEETRRGTSKDTSRMLDSGAAKVYFAKVWDDQLLSVFQEIMKEIPEGTPVICESPALRNFVEPGVFIIMTSDSINKHKDVIHLKALPHVMIKYEDLNQMQVIPISFDNAHWSLLPPGRYAAVPRKDLT